MSQRFTLFISDLHLQVSTPEIFQAFLQVLDEHASKADALYILGDFFEVWIGDDAITAFQHDVIDALKKLQIPVYFMHGNRDFLIGNQFAQLANVTLLNDPSVINLYGKPVLLAHGDALCTDDRMHQIFRTITRSILFKNLFLLLPKSWREKIAQSFRQKSTSRKKMLNQSIMDVNPTAVTNLMQKNQVDFLIHGHTHRPKIHEIPQNNHPATRIVLGDWHHSTKILTYFEDHNYELKQINWQQ